MLQQYENETLSFYKVKVYLKFINDKSLREDILFHKIIPEIKIPSNNIDDISIYIHFLFHNLLFLKIE